jgi:DNA polymerase-3 subunit delta
MAASKRARAGRAVLADVVAETARGWTAGLTVLAGDDRYHRERAERAILAALGGGADEEYGRTVFGDAKIDLTAVIAAARSVGMFAPRRVVVVRDVAALAADDDGLGVLAEYAATPPARSHLVVRAPALDLRRKLHKALAESGRLLEFVLPEGEARLTAALPVAREMARDRDLRMDADALALLVELTAGDIERVEHELDKLAAWLERPADAVTADAVLDVAASGGLASGWAAAGCLTRRDRPGMIAALRRSIDAGEVPLKVLGGLAWRGRVLLQAKALAEARRPMREILERTRAWRFDEDLAAGIARYDLDRLLRFPAAFLAADRTLKSRSIAGRAVLEDLADRLTGDRR